MMQSVAHLSTAALNFILLRKYKTLHRIAAVATQFHIVLIFYLSNPSMIIGQAVVGTPHSHFRNVMQGR